MVVLEKMTKQDFESYIENAVKEYAKEKVTAGTWIEEEALKLSKEAFDRLLPDGVATANQYLYSLVDTDANVSIGYIWFQLFEKLSGREAFIFDFIIHDRFRGKGYGTQSMNALEREAHTLDIHKISLHVFGHNHTAIGLYNKMGYVTTDLHMSKVI